MGFRNPITSATALDTGAAPDRSSVYIDATSELLGFRGFFSGDRDATVQRTLLSPFGGRLRVNGGMFYTGPEKPVKSGAALDLEVNNGGAAGAYQSVLRVSGADVIDFSGTDVKPQATAFVATWLAGFRDWPTGQERPQFTHHADGLVTFTGLAQNNSGATRGGVGTSTQIANIPAGFVPPVTAIRIALANGSVNCRVDFSSDGHLYLVDCPVIPVGSQLVFGVAYRLDATASA